MNHVEMVDICFSIPRELLATLNHSEETKQIFYRFMGDVMKRISSIHNSGNQKKCVYHTPSMITNTDCSICLEPISLYSSINILPCRHGFHVGCMNELVDSHYYSCPTCRAPL